ncbi:MAG: glucose-6-phosphate dehydrogenase [Chlamydiales bacterium]|nr:glucose-6-phosphate dehydrogenase [Chlamydiales bacterium]
MCFLSNELDASSPSPSASDPCVIVVFGATGDLTARKLLPAIYNLSNEGNLSRHTAVVGFARRDYTDSVFRKQMCEAIEQYAGTAKDTDLWNQFENRIFYHQSSFDQDEGYENLQQLLSKIDLEFGTQGNRLYYLATQPSYFSTIIKKLSEHGLLYDSNSPHAKWSKVIIEKPFGVDLASAIDLQKDISRYLDESQVYRMDHYLGKEGVQNLFTLRFESALFEPFWNSEYIDNVQITLGEDIGIGSRANFWEETGSLRDVFQNHLMQLLAIVAMEPPSTLNSIDIHQEKTKLLNAIRPFSVDEMNNHVIRGQYGPGTIRGLSVPGYKQEKGVSEDSSSETFIAAKIFIDNPRWEGVPFYIRGGKRLPKQTTEIAITFKNRNPSIDHAASNVLFIRIQPNAGIFFKTVSKVPSLDKSLEPVIFGYNPDSYFDKRSPEAYEKLFYDCIRGDDSLYVQGEEQLAVWRLLTPVLNYWKAHAHEKVPVYDAGTWGPSAADQMLNENGHQWQMLEN